MVKILVADLLDTLLPMKPEILDLLYGTRENVDFFQDRSDDVRQYWTSLSNQAMRVLIEELRIFLEQGNELVIVTSLSHFTSAGMIEYIKRIYSALPQYFNQIKVVFKGQECDLESNHVILENGITYLEVQGFKIEFVYDKEDVFDLIDISGKQLYTIGNDNLDDSGMMFRSFDVNGNVSLINYWLNKPISDDEQTIRYYIGHLAKTKIDLGLCEYGPEWERIAASYREGKVSIQDIHKLDDLYGIIKGYNIHQRFGNFENRGVKITDPEYIERFVALSSVYPTFKEYNRRVLIRK